MVFISFLTMDWDCGLRRIQEKVQNCTILVMMGSIDQKFRPVNDPAKILRGLKKGLSFDIESLLVLYLV
jgi:hypothetical protein